MSDHVKMQGCPTPPPEVSGPGNNREEISHEFLRAFVTHVVNSYIQGTPIGTIRKYISIDTYAEFQQRINWRAEGGLTDNRDSCKLAQKVYATGSVPGKIEVIATMTTKIRSHIFMAEFSWMNGQWKATYMRIL